MYNRTVINQFRNLFQVVSADTDELKAAVYRIRYGVYCDEFGYEDKEKFPDGKEMDSCDDRSLHYLIQHKPSRRLVGCIRLILPDPCDPMARFPFEIASRGQIFNDILDLNNIDRRRLGEVSRLTVVSSFRNRIGERNRPEQVVTKSTRLRSGEQRRYPHVAMGLYLAGAAAMLSSGLEGVFAMMEPKLARGVAAFGLKFRQVSDVVDYHGKRAAFYIQREEVLAGLPAEGRALLEMIQRDLEIDKEVKDNRLTLAVG